mgnify:CR=1 FL=1
MASIIDNRNKTMLDSLKNSLKQAESVDILTAFFYFSGFNALAEELKDKIPETFFKEAEFSEKSFREDIIPDLQEENKLSTEYSKLIASAAIEFEGKTYNQIMEMADISSATLSRVSRCVQYGKGYSNVLKK